MYKIEKAKFGGGNVIVKDGIALLTTTRPSVDVERMVKAFELYDRLEREFNPVPLLIISDEEKLRQRLKRNRVRVDSSWIRSVAYDSETKFLQIEKDDGGYIQHKDVPPYIVSALMSHSSVGQAYNFFVKGRFPLAQ
jgi:hypothetical protein